MDNQPSNDREVTSVKRIDLHHVEDGIMELSIQAQFTLIDKDDAKAIIQHLTEQFKLDSSPTWRDWIDWAAKTEDSLRKAHNLR